ncbi:MAG: isoprenylcysteine carboxylmethyltransferase family protein [Chloroflexi bacterium]|nr:isoprenylcysteine carboxylmethyltransferase family protein [Chloroflexota bacterium]
MNAASILLYRVLIWGGALVAGTTLQRVWPLGLLPPPGALALGMALGAAGSLLLAWAVVTMARQGGSPNPYQPSRALVTSGPFRISRNPIYLSFLLLYLGFAAVVNGAWFFILTPGILLALQKLIVGQEEEDLGQRFGEEYRAYCRRVRRWM